MKDKRLTPVQFTTPPVVEVVCGVSFALPKPLKTAHIGRYWALVANEFPRCDEAAPLALIVEGESSSDADGRVLIEETELPPLRRSWLINEAGTNIIQLQDDRFLFNWKRENSDIGYPSYQEVIGDFRKRWDHFNRFLVQWTGEPRVTQLEMTYWNFLDNDESVLRDYVRDVSSEGDRFLPPPMVSSWRSTYVLPEGDGRLHIAAGSARHTKTGQRGIRLELTARGLPNDTSPVGCASWFDRAHDWITHGFADVTTKRAHEIWGRTA